MTCTGGIEWMGWTVSTEHGSHRGVTERHPQRGITLLEKAQPGWIEHAGGVRTARTGAVVSGRTARVFPPSRATWCPGAGAPSSWGGTTSCAPLTSARVPTAAEKSRKKWKLHPTPRGSALKLDDRQTDRDPRDCMSSLFFSARKLEIHGTLVERTPPGAVLTSTRRRRFERSHRRESIPRVPARGRTNPAHANGEPRRRRTQLSEFEGRVH
jgi:hypothetical protein